MALINCPECNSSASSFAVACPVCGYPISKWVEEQAKAQEKKSDIGGEILFGRYRVQRTNTDSKDIEWIIADSVGEYDLLISKYCIEYKRFGDAVSKGIWKNSDIRQWLNTSFYETAFDDTERDAIVPVSLINEIEVRYTGSDPIRMTDKIFLISRAESKKYLKLIKKNDTEYVDAKRYSRMIESRAYKRMEETKVYKYKEDKAYYPTASKYGWWMRNAIIPGRPDYILYKGDGQWYSVADAYNVCMVPSGIRPALWVKRNG